jgi:GNAT superfamily N-acetyltransferase
MFDIRPATEDDLDVVMDMGEKFYNESPYSDVKPFNYKGMRAYALQLIEDHHLLIALKNGEAVGMAASYMAFLPINPDIFVSSEVVFWVEPEHRGSSLAIRLMGELEKAVGVEEPDVMFMSSLSTSPPVTDKLYKKMGYIPTETAYMRNS